MDIEDIKAQIEKIKNSGDPESQHRMEDDLYISVLTAIANGANDPSSLAKEVLKVSELDFPRWYA